jgi:hypothetical protein
MGDKPMRNVLRRKYGKISGVSLTILALLTGCAPSSQALPPDLSQGTPVATGWSTIQHAVALSAQANMYAMKTGVDVTQGTLKTAYTTYGSINLPNTISLSIHEQNFNVRYYQQGNVAYEFSDNRWAEAAPLADMNVLYGYRQLVASVPAQSVTVYQLPDQFVVTEYCHIYKVIIPSKYVTALIGWDKGANMHYSSDVAYTFAVGGISGDLREVTTDSVGEVPAVGPVQVSSDTELFDYNEPQALVKLPPDLVDKLS